MSTSLLARYYVACPVSQVPLTFAHPQGAIGDPRSQHRDAPLTYGGVIETHISEVEDMPAL
jgi:hypothetical protein